MTDKTLIKNLKFPGSWRLKEALRDYNRTVDKSSRITTVADLRKLESKQTLSLYGVGRKTLERIQELLNAPR